MEVDVCSTKGFDASGSKTESSHILRKPAFMPLVLLLLLLLLRSRIIFFLSKVTDSAGGWRDGESDDS